MKGMLEGKICLVTGASRGIGKAIVERYAKEGGIVYAAAKTPGSMDAWAAEISGASTGGIIPVYFNLKDTQEIRELVIRIKKEKSRLDIVVNNAGIVQNELLGMISGEKMAEMFAINVFALIQLCQYAARIMCRQKSGSIINISSIVGVEGSKGQVAYAASKGAVISATKSMAKELAPYNIRVNSVAPGMTDTERIRVTIASQYKGKIPEIGMGRLATPADIANACVYFGSDESAYVTGQVLVVGGGYDTTERNFYEISYE